MNQEKGGDFDIHRHHCCIKRMKRSNLGAGTFALREHPPHLNAPVDSWRINCEFDVSRWALCLPVPTRSHVVALPRCHPIRGVKVFGGKVQASREDL
jgi:hypothetical protein